MAPSEYLDELSLNKAIEGFSKEAQFLAEQQFRMSKQIEGMRKHMEKCETENEERFKKIEKKCEDCSTDSKQKWFNGTSVTALVTAIGAFLSSWIVGK